MKPKTNRGISLLFALMMILVFSFAFNEMWKHSRNYSETTHIEVSKKIITRKLTADIQNFKSKLLSQLEANMVLSAGDNHPLDLEALHYDFQAIQGMILSYKCVYEYISINPPVTAVCTKDRNRLPKVIRVSIFDQSDDNLVALTASSEILIDRTQINNYSYILGAQPKGTKVALGGGTYGGPVSIIFADGADPGSQIIWANQTPLTITGLLTSNISTRGQIGFLKDQPGYEHFVQGKVEMPEGMRYGDGFTSPLREVAPNLRSLASNSSTIKANGDARITFKENGEILFQNIDSNGTPVTILDKKVADGSVFYASGNLTVIGEDPNRGALIQNDRMTLIANDNLNLGSSIYRDPDPLYPSYKGRLALVAIHGHAGVVSEDTFVRGMNTTFGALTNDIAPETNSLRVDASVVTLAGTIDDKNPKAALYVKPSLYEDQTRAHQLGSIYAEGLVAADLNAGIRKMWPTGVASTGFAGISQVHPGEGLLNPLGTPVGLNSSTSANLTAAISSLTFEASEAAMKISKK